MLSLLLATSISFTAVATGVEKGTPVEFAFVGADSDRDYESLFLIEESVDDFCHRLEKAGLPRRKPEDGASCVLWPVGCTLTLSPSLDEFLDTRYPETVEASPIVYTGGKRLASGLCDAGTNMPLAVFALYSLPQSPLVFAAHYSQSTVYGCHVAKSTLKKGTRHTFTLSWDEKSMPAKRTFTLTPDGGVALLADLKKASEAREIVAQVNFAPTVTVAEAGQVAKALALVDSRRVKINGRNEGQLFFKAFLPDERWRKRENRLLQPFELTLGETNTLVFIEADWTVEGLDPKLTPTTISISEAKKHRDTDTCFIYAKPATPLSALYKAMDELKDSPIRTWYVFQEEEL